MVTDLGVKCKGIIGYKFSRVCMSNTESLSFTDKKYGHGSVQPYKGEKFTKFCKHICGTINKTTPFKRTFIEHDIKFTLNKAHVNAIQGNKHCMVVSYRFKYRDFSKAEIKNSPVSCLLGQNFRVGKGFILFCSWQTHCKIKTYHCCFTLYWHVIDPKRSSYLWKSFSSVQP